MPNKSENPVRDRTVAARIVDLIQAEGIDTIFGIPDPGFQRMYRVASERGMRLVAPHHESAGGFMADAVTRMTGKPSIVIGNQGPGVANLLPAAVSASKEKVPVISWPASANVCSTPRYGAASSSTRPSRASSKPR